MKKNQSSTKQKKQTNNPQPPSSQPQIIPQTDKNCQSNSSLQKEEPSQSSPELKSSPNEMINDNPDQGENTEQNEHLLSKNEIKQYTHLLFLNLAKFSAKDNDYFISQQSLNKILKENSIINPKVIKLSEVDLLFKTISPKSLKLNSNQFLTFLLRLTQKIYPKEFKKNPKQTINFFLGNLFENYADILNNEKVPLESIADSSCQYKSIETLLSYIPNDKQIFIINKIIFTLNEIYIKYFVYELESSTDLARKSVVNLIAFARDFEILPFIISETQLVTYYHLSINNNDNNIAVIEEKYNQGENFTFNNFCIFIIHFALLSYTKTVKGTTESSNDTEATKLLMFLERLETSKGMKSFTRKLNRPSANKLSLIPPKEVFVQLGELNEDINTTISNNTTTSFMVDNYNSKLINDSIDDLHRTFLYYGRIGDKLNFDQMTLSSYTKFLKHCGLMRSITEKERKKYNTISQEIIAKTYNNTRNNNSYISPSVSYSQEEIQYKRTMSKVVNSASTNNAREDRQLGESDVNVIFSMLTGPRTMSSSFSSSSNDTKMLRMNFSIFLKSFDVIASKLYPNEDHNTALSHILNERILPNIITTEKANDINKTNNETEIEETYQKICSSNEIKSFLKRLSESVSVYYQFYCDEKNGMLDFNGLYDYYKSFGLFPDIINLVELKNIYSYLVSLHKNSKLSSMSTSNKSYMTYSDFIYSLGITALLFDFDDEFSDIDKMLYLVERMNQSAGIKKCQMKTGRTYTKSKDMVSFLLSMKKEYPEFYKVNSKSIFMNKKGKENDLVDNIDDIYSEEEVEEEGKDENIQEEKNVEEDLLNN